MAPPTTVHKIGFKSQIKKTAMRSADNAPPDFSGKAINWTAQCTEHTHLKILLDCLTTKTAFGCWLDEEEMETKFMFCSPKNRASEIKFDHYCAKLMKGYVFRFLSVKIFFYQWTRQLSEYLSTALRTLYVQGARKKYKKNINEEERKRVARFKAQDKLFYIQLNERKRPWMGQDWSRLIRRWPFNYYPI